LRSTEKMDVRGLYFQTIYDTLWKQKRIRYEMNFKEEIPLGGVSSFFVVRMLRKQHDFRVVSSFGYRFAQEGGKL